MKNLKSKIKLNLCLLILCFSTFAQTKSKDDCENFILITRADLEKCATYKRQNDFLEKEIKFQAIERTSLQHTIIAKDNSITIIKKALIKETESKKTWRKTTFIIGIILFLLLALVIFGHKLAKFIVVFCLFSVQGFAQIPDYRPPFSLNGQKGLSQKMTIDTTASNFSIESSNDAHNIKIPYKSIYLKPGNQFQYLRGDKTWQTLNKAAIGLENVDNTSDANKPISTNTQIALNNKENAIYAGETTQYYRGDKTWQTLNKGAVGLQNVDNTTDIEKPLSALMINALNLKASQIDFSTHNHSLDNLSNIAITTKATNDLLRWNGTAWSNFTPNYFVTSGGTLTGALTLQYSIRTGGTGNSDDNTFFGKNALISRINGHSNTGFGTSVLSSLTTGTYNSVYGRNAGASITTGQYNTYLGHGTGSGITTGSFNTIIGSQVASLSASTSNNVIIADGQGNQRIRVDAAGNAGFGITTPAYKVDIAGTLRASGAVNFPTYTNGILKVDATGNVSVDNNTYAAVSRFNNVTITDSSSFTHALGTQRIDVAFFEAGLKEITVIDWYPDSSNTIKVYLPYRDKTTKYKFTGDVFITKRY